jgi:hypothetical protein
LITGSPPKASLSIWLIGCRDETNLLRSRADLPIGELTTAAQNLIRELGWPLVIDSAGAYIKNMQKTLEEYNLLLRDSPRELLGRRSELPAHPEPVLLSIGMGLKKSNHARIRPSFGTPSIPRSFRGNRRVSSQGRFPTASVNSRNEKESIDPSA